MREKGCEELDCGGKGVVLNVYMYVHVRVLYICMCNVMQKKISHGFLYLS